MALTTGINPILLYLVNLIGYLKMSFFYDVTDNELALLIKALLDVATTRGDKYTDDEKLTADELALKLDDIYGEIGDTDRE